MIELGAYAGEEIAKQRLIAVQNRAGMILGGADPVIDIVEIGGSIYYRARFAGFDKEQAEGICRSLKRINVACVVVSRVHNEPGSPQAATTPRPEPTEVVAPKAVLYEEDPDDPNGKRFVGLARWRTQTVMLEPGQPLDLAIRAVVEVPERKLTMSWLLRRNTDKRKPTSHIVEITFLLPADFPSGGITNVPGILMKQAEQTRGVPLAGSAVKVTNGFYLIGLSNLDNDKERNVQMLKERAWFDIPVVYSNNRRAILAIEKGSPGERVFADTFKAWETSP
jgi:hypothetical protein